MSNYRHGNWYCKPASEAEAKEIIERAVASGAKRQETLEDYYWNDLGVWGVYRGRTLTQNMDFYRNVGTTEYTIEQVREKFPLPGDHKQAGMRYHIGTPIEVRMNGVWHTATVYGRAGDCIIARAEGYWYDEYPNADVRPIRSERERWVSEAQKHCTDFIGNQLGKLYDALKSGDLKAPEVE